MKWLLSAAFLSIVIGGSFAGPRDAAGETTFAYVKIVDTNTPIPGGAGNFTELGQVALSDGLAAFVGRGGSGDGIYTRLVNDPSSLAVRYDRNTVRPGGGGAKLSGFGIVSLSHGSVAFKANGIYTDVGGTLFAVADTSTPIPGGTGTFTKFGDPWLYDGELVFRGFGTGQEGIYAYSGGALVRIADTTTPVPGGTGLFVSFGPVPDQFSVWATPAIDDGVVVFRGVGSNGERGVYRAAGGVIEAIADLNTPIPGGTGNFTIFDGSLLAGNIEGDAIVFVGEGSDGRRGLYLHDGTSLSVILDANTFHGGGSQGVGFDNGAVSFLGDGPGGQVIFATLGGVLRTVVVDNDVLDGKVSFAFGTYGHSLDGNMVAFNVGNYGGYQSHANYVAIASNDPPVAANDTLSVPEDGAATRNVLSNDTDPDGDVLFVSGFTHGSRGTVTCTAAGACTYTATTPNYSGSDSFTYTVSDGRGGTAVGTVNVTITPVDDADVSVAMTASQNPAGRGRTLTYTIVVSNAGPETARTVSLVDTLPAGTSFASMTTTQGTMKPPPVGGTGTASVIIGSLAKGATATVTLTVNVLASAGGMLSNTATASTNGSDPVPGNNSATSVVTVAGVGTFALTPKHLTVAVGDHTHLALEWTIPGPSWRDLKDLHLRVRDGDGTVLWVRLTEGNPSLLALHDGDTGRFGPGKAPGSNAVLSTSTAKLYLGGTSVTADGPTDPSVVMTLDVSFKQGAGGRTYVVEVKASDDLGNVQDWKRAGTLTVTRRHGGHDRDDD